MARPPTGSIVRDDRGDEVRYGLRFRAYGKRRYVSLGAVTFKEAEVELANVLADVRRGIWKPEEPVPPVQAPAEEVTFHEYVSKWLARRKQEGLRGKTLADLEWSIELHLLPFFAPYALSQITPRLVQGYTETKLAEREAIRQARAAAKEKGEPFNRRPLSNNSINHTLRHLSQILDDAVFPDELLASNPAANKKLRLNSERPSRPWVEPEQLMMFLDAAPKGVGRTLLGLLAGAGLRIGEALALVWRDVDLGTATLYVRDAKTPKGVREVHLTPALREELTVWKATTEHAAPAEHVVSTKSGKRHNESNLRRDVLAKTVAAANESLEAVSISPIGKLTFHSLRRTYASLRCVCGDDMRYTADQLGHEDARFTMRCYAQASKRRDRMAKPQRDAFDRAVEWAAMGSNELLTLPVAIVAEAAA